MKKVLLLGALLGALTTLGGPGGTAQAQDMCIWPTDLPTGNCLVGFDAERESAVCERITGEDASDPEWASCVGVGGVMNCTTISPPAGYGGTVCVNTFPDGEQDVCWQTTPCVDGVGETVEWARDTVPHPLCTPTVAGGPPPICVTYPWGQD